MTTMRFEMSCASAARMVMLAGALAIGEAACADVTVVLRGGETTVEAAAATAGARGLELRRIAGKVVTGGSSVNDASSSGDIIPRDIIPWDIIPWDMVRAVNGDVVIGLDEPLVMGKDLWRARIRLERGDEAFAEPLITKHWSRLRLIDGPTAALAAEGLLRCAIARKDLVAAIDPWLVCLRLGSGGEPSRFAGLPPVLDDATGLLPALAPFVRAAARSDLADACEAVAAADTPKGIAAEVAARLARIMRATSARTADAGAAAGDPGREAAPAVRALGLLEGILAATDARARAKAIAEFERAFPDAPGYLATWKLAAAGAQAARMARLAPTDVRNRALELAALDLLAVPSSGFDTTGLVDAYALEEAATLLDEAGDTASSAQVKAILRDAIRGAVDGQQGASISAPNDQTIPSQGQDGSNAGRTTQ